MTDAPRPASTPTGGAATADQVSLERWTVTSGSQRQQPRRGRAPGRQPRLAGVGRGHRRRRRAVQGDRPGARRPSSTGTRGSSPTTSTRSPRARRPRAGSSSRSPRRRARQGTGRTAGSPARSRRTNTIAASVEAYVEALNAMLAEQSWAGAADEAGARRSERRQHATRPAPTTEFDDRGRPHRHDGVVQPLGGDGSATAASAAIDPEAFNRFEAEGWEARAESYGFLAPITGRVIGALLAAVQAGPGVQLLDVGSGPGRPRGGGRPAGRGRGRASTSRRRWSGGPRSPTRRSRSGSARSRRCPVARGRSTRSSATSCSTTSAGRRTPSREARRVLRPGRPGRALDLGRAEPQPRARAGARCGRRGRCAAPAGPARGTDQLPRRRRAAGAVRGRRVRRGRRLAPPLRDRRRRRGHAVARRPRLRGADPATRDRAAGGRPGAGSGRRSTSSSRSTGGRAARSRSRSRSR